MAKNTYKVNKKINWKHILVIVLAGLALCACTVGIFASRSDKKEISAGAFSVGGLNERGEYVEQSNTIFTEELIECQGLEITPDFKSTVEYRVYLYASDYSFLEASEKLTGNYKLNNSMAQYARIMIIPEDSAKKDFEIGYFDVRDYAKQITIKVNREQNFELRNYFEANKSQEGKVASSTSASLTYVAKEGYGVSKLANCEDMVALDVKYIGDSQPDDIEILFYSVSESGDIITYTFVSSVKVSGDVVTSNVAVPANVTHFIVNYRLGEDFVINQALKVVAD